MPLRKIGKYYYIDIRIKGKNKRIRESLGTTNRTEALERYNEKKEEILNHFSGKNIKFKDFCNQYLEWAWSSKLASALREKQRLQKIKDFFSQFDIEYLSDITPYHIEKLKSYLKGKDLSKFLFSIS